MSSTTGELLLSTETTFTPDLDCLYSFLEDSYAQKVMGENSESSDDKHNQENDGWKIATTVSMDTHNTEGRC